MPILFLLIGGAIGAGVALVASAPEKFVELIVFTDPEKAIRARDNLKENGIDSRIIVTGVSTFSLEVPEDEFERAEDLLVI